MSHFVEKLKPDEQLIRILRRSPITLFFPILTSLTLILSPFFLLYPLFQLKAKGIAVFCFMLTLGIWLSIRTFVEWYYNIILITNQRIIILKQRGFFEKKFSETDLKAVRNVSYKIKGILPTLFNQGMIRIDLPSEGVKSNYIIIPYIRAPQKIHELILRLRNEVLEKETKKKLSDRFLTAEEIMKNTPMQELFKIVRQTKNIMGTENFKKEFINNERGDIGIKEKEK